ncbi:SulP family inorganic anion transporter [Serpentinimonas maccroryi]|uniref:SulP family inorganic anion transporter n=1 Tax=Serpentinimonas maccroryi TaxID=1458426 RepID=UPI0020336DAC|nr:SulP family inorganic anion transporter [Serpentinimonas maccroryi]MCM2477905.1 STAS domain-containing protein [Serpentinimonas maccroryi]
MSAPGSSRWARLFPFLDWFPVSFLILRGDLIAGITGALVLVPKAMAYAQLSGLPVHFGLYVALVPAIIAALWGSSRQLSTGPVAIISLMTAAAITPLAVPLSAEFIELALLLTLMVGIIQFALGAFKLGTIVNFVSHPVILGFMNAAAIIIALSQLNMLLGIPKGSTGSFLGDVWETLSFLPQTHLPTLGMAFFALVLMLVLKRIGPISKLSVLIAVAVTIVVSALIGFEQKTQVRIDQVIDTPLRESLLAYDQTNQRIRALNAQAVEQAARLRALPETDERAIAALRHALHLSELDAADSADENKQRWRELSRLRLARIEAPAGGEARFALPGQAGADVQTDGRSWRIMEVADGELQLSGGGDVVGNIQQGLPELRLPTIGFDAFLSLLSAAVVIALVGFMESMAMAKALAAKTRQRLNPNQELLGQGLANLAGSFFQSYPASGSFTGSAINLQAGAKTGFAMVFNALFIAATLLFLTPLLYHLPKATLGVIILLAVTSLITPAALKHTWRANRADGVVAAITFVVTLVAAPHLDQGILIGAGLAVLLYLWRTMKPRVAVLGRHPDGVLRDVQVHPDLPTSPEVLALRFDDTLYFANAAFFESQVLDELAKKPTASHLLIVANGINQMDASGEEVVRHLVERLRAGGIQVVFCGVKKQVLDVMRRTDLDQLIGADNLYPNEEQALTAIYATLGRDGRSELLPPGHAIILPLPSTPTGHQQTP